MAFWTVEREDRPGANALARAPRRPLPRQGLDPAAQSSDTLAQWRRVVEKLGLPHNVVMRLLARSRANHTSFQTELLASGLVDEQAHYRAIADDAGLRFMPEVDGGRLIIRDDDFTAAIRGSLRGQLALYHEGHGPIRTLIAPTGLDLGALRRLLANRPWIADRMSVVTPTALRNAILAKARPVFSQRAVNGLFTATPELSARFVLAGSQGLLLGGGLALLGVGFVLAPWRALGALHWIASLFFLACAGLRFAAAWAARPPAPAELDRRELDGLPVYSVLVALRDEAEIVPELLQALGRMVWPRSRLEIKFLCEADDARTLAALRAHALSPCVEIVEIPPSEPRTKPKALAYALPLTTGEFVALYDAEDRPHPYQLVEAWRRFRDEDDDLACLQAPLDIGNASAGAIPLMFSFEYSALFRGLLPFLARRRLVMPLGGTSNHFRRTALEEVGGWDPFNVTEDADLGLRLARFGYRSATLSLPTLEDAPDRLGVWMRQRSRWFKGWAHTWLVHMRQPLRLLREVGFGSFLVCQIAMAGMVASALLHPLLLATFAFMLGRLAIFGTLAGEKKLLFGLDLFDVALAYSAFLWLGWRTLPKGRRGAFGRVIAYTPFYWIMMSFAAWRGVLQLTRRPHLWEKTPHRPRAKLDASRRAQPEGGEKD